MTVTVNDIKTFVNEASDQEILVAFSLLQDRLSLTTEFIEDEDEVIGATMLVAVAGNSAVFSEPNVLEEPLVAVDWESYH